MKTTLIPFLLASISLTMAEWPPSKAPVVPEADGYVAIPDAALAPGKEMVYRAIFDATRPAEKPSQLLPALNMAGSELNALGSMSLPLTNAQFVVVFHGAAVDGI